MRLGFPRRIAISIKKYAAKLSKLCRRSFRKDIMWTAFPALDPDRQLLTRADENTERQSSGVVNLQRAKSWRLVDAVFKRRHLG